MKDYYSILHVLPSAEIDVIKAAYKALARKYHPDTFDGDKKYASQRMQEINDSFGVIGDPEKRNKYDAERKADICLQQPMAETRECPGCRAELSLNDVLCVRCGWKVNIGLREAEEALRAVRERNRDHSAPKTNENGSQLVPEEDEDESRMPERRKSLVVAALLLLGFCSAAFWGWTVRPKLSTMDTLSDSRQSSPSEGVISEKANGEVNSIGSRPGDAVLSSGVSPHMWTGQNGITIEAELVSISDDGTTVTLKKTDGEVRQGLLTKLSDEDQALIKAQQAKGLVVFNKRWVSQGEKKELQEEMMAKAFSRLKNSPLDPSALADLKSSLQNVTDTNNLYRLGTIHSLGCYLTDRKQGAGAEWSWLRKVARSDPYVQLLVFQYMGQKCDACKGEGKVPVPCSNCKGSGRCQFCSGKGEYDLICRGTGKCPKCRGNKTDGLTTCANCRGTGFVISEPIMKRAYLALLNETSPEDVADICERKTPAPTSRDGMVVSSSGSKVSTGSTGWGSNDEYMKRTFGGRIGVTHNTGVFGPMINPDGINW